MLSPIISIIVPVYNVEKYLIRCIDSVLNQSFKDFELLLINDGSSDKSGDICDKYAKEDKRIKVFHKENGGVSSARNFGIGMATGTWISFIDSDDYVGENYLLNLYSSTLGTNIDFVQAGYIKVNSSMTQSVKCTAADINTKSMEQILHILRGFSISKLFKHDIIKQKNIRFDPSLTLAEDLCFNLNYISHIKQAAFITNTDYFYVFNERSASYKLHTPNSLLFLWKNENQLINSIQRKYNLSSDILYEWKVDIANNIFSWISSWIIYNASGPFDRNIVKELKTHYGYYISILKEAKPHSYINRCTCVQICERRFLLASIMLFFTSMYKKFRYKYEV